MYRQTITACIQPRNSTKYCLKYKYSVCLHSQANRYTHMYIFVYIPDNAYGVVGQEIYPLSYLTQCVWQCHHLSSGWVCALSLTQPVRMDRTQSKDQLVHIPQFQKTWNTFSKPQYIWTSKRQFPGSNISLLPIPQKTISKYVTKKYIQIKK